MNQVFLCPDNAPGKGLVRCNPRILAARERHRQGTGAELSWV